MQRLVGFSDFKNLSISLNGKKFQSPEKFEKIKKTKWLELKNNAISGRYHIWNGSIYRLSKITKRKTSILLSLSQIDYKTHYASAFANTIFNNLPFEKKPNGIFQSAFIRTKDGYWLFGQSNPLNPANSSNISLIGGNLSPQDCEIRKPSDLSTALVKEITEETAISMEYLSPPVGIGIYRSDTDRIGFFYYCQLTITRQQAYLVSKTSPEHTCFIFWTTAQTLGHLNKPDIHPNINKLFPLLKIYLKLWP